MYGRSGRRESREAAPRPALAAARRNTPGRPPRRRRPPGWRGRRPDRLRRPVPRRQDRPHHLRHGPHRLVRRPGQRQRPGRDGRYPQVADGDPPLPRGHAARRGGGGLQPAGQCLCRARGHPGGRPHGDHLRPLQAAGRRRDARRGGEGQGGAHVGSPARRLHRPHQGHRHRRRRGPRPRVGP